MWVRTGDAYGDCFVVDPWRNGRVGAFLVDVWGLGSGEMDERVGGYCFCFE